MKNNTVKNKYLSANTTFLWLFSVPFLVSFYKLTTEEVSELLKN